MASASASAALRLESRRRTKQLPRKLKQAHKPETNTEMQPQAKQKQEAEEESGPACAAEQEELEEAPASGAEAAAAGTAEGQADPAPAPASAGVCSSFSLEGLVPTFQVGQPLREARRNSARAPQSVSAPQQTGSSSESEQTDSSDSSDSEQQQQEEEETGSEPQQTASDSASESSDEEQRDCALCLEPFSTDPASPTAGQRDGRPRTLACGCTFCPCIEAWMKERDTCPTCLDPITASSIREFGVTRTVIKSLRRNEQLRAQNTALQAALQATKQSAQGSAATSSASPAPPVSCSDPSGAACDGEECSAPALFYCAECGANYCDACKHKPIPGHKLVNVAQKDKLLAASARCRAHPEEKLKAYCSQCKTLVCNDCLLHGAHKGHDTLVISEAAAARRKEIETAKEQIRKQLATLEEEAKVPDVSSIAEARLEQLNELTDSMIAEVQQMKERLSKKIKEEGKTATAYADFLKGKLSGVLDETGTSLLSLSQLADADDLQLLHKLNEIAPLVQQAQQRISAGHVEVNEGRADAAIDLKLRPPPTSLLQLRDLLERVQLTVTRAQTMPELFVHALRSQSSIMAERHLKLKFARVHMLFEQMKIAQWQPTLLYCATHDGWAQYIMDSRIKSFEAEHSVQGILMVLQTVEDRGDDRITRVFGRWERSADAGGTVAHVFSLENPLQRALCFPELDLKHDFMECVDTASGGEAMYFNPKPDFGATLAQAQLSAEEAAVVFGSKENPPKLIEVEFFAIA